MSTYDIVWKDQQEVQIKSWSRTFREYRVGDMVPGLGGHRSYCIAAALGDLSYQLTSPDPDSFFEGMTQLKPLEEPDSYLNCYRFDIFLVIRNRRLDSIEEHWKKARPPIFSKFGDLLDIKVLNPSSESLPYLYFSKYRTSTKSSCFAAASASTADAVGWLRESVAQVIRGRAKHHADILRGTGFSHLVVQTHDELMYNLAKGLAKLPVGTKSARRYHTDAVRLIEYLFNDLADPLVESKTSRGTERRDAIFYNAATAGFWKDIKDKHQATHVVVESKNTLDIKLEFINQIAAYLKPALGHFGIIVTRRDPGRQVIEKALSVYNSDRKVVLFLSDRELVEMVRNKCYQRGFADYDRHYSPNVRFRRLYSHFMQLVQ